MKNAAISFLLAAGIGLVPGCMSDFDAKPDQSDKKGGSGGKEDAYNPYNDNPATFANDLEHRLAELPLSGGATVAPWAGNYWPTYQDNINYRWNGASSESPAEKYGRAFGIANLEDKISQEYGIDRYRGSRTACTSTSDCDSSLGESCAKRRGQSDGVCIPTWWGICHAWAPLALSIPEPKYPVTYNGVEFKVNDIKALLTLSWNRTNSKFVSTRCNKNGNDLTHDAYGNYRDDPECENTNPGTWHIIATNYLGVRNESFVYDRTYDDQVWNQPLRDYEITKQELISARKANELTGVTAAGGTTVNASGTVAKDAFFHQPPVAVTAGDTLNVTMTGSNDADLHVRFGAQPTASAYDCRPYDNGSNEQCSLQVPAGATEAYVSVRGYADSSDFQLAIVSGGTVPDTYQHNANAAELYLVNMKVGYISESDASTDGNLADDIDRYTHYDRYEYVLEVDAAGKIIGGVWIGESISTHPDFLWLPTGPRDATVASGSISRAQIMTLVEMSLQEPGGGGGETGPVTVNETGSVAKDKWVHYGPFESSDGIQVTMTGTEDADLYVRKNAAPTRAAYDCRPYRNGSSESCAVTGAGTFYVSVNGWAASSSFDVTIEYTTGTGSNDPIDPVDAVEHFTETGAVAQGEMKYYTLEVNAGHRVFIRTFAQKDVDLYIQLNGQPTTSAYLERAWTTSGNEVIEYTPTQNGTLHIGVHGYAGSDFTLRTADL